MKIRLGEKYWCVLKASVVDENQKEKPEFLAHLAVGYVKSKGIQLDDDGGQTLFVEMCGQRLKADMVFDSYDRASKKLFEMIDEIGRGINAVPPIA